MTWHLGGVVGIFAAMVGCLLALNNGVIQPTFTELGAAYVGLTVLGYTVHRMSPYPALTDRLDYRQSWGLSRDIRGENA